MTRRNDPQTLVGLVAATALIALALSPTTAGLTTMPEFPGPEVETANPGPYIAPDLECSQDPCGYEDTCSLIHDALAVHEQTVTAGAPRSAARAAFEDAAVPQGPCEGWPADPCHDCEAQINLNCDLLAAFIPTSVELIDCDGLDPCSEPETDCGVCDGDCDVDPCQDSEYVYAPVDCGGCQGDCNPCPDEGCTPCPNPELFPATIDCGGCDTDCDPCSTQEYDASSQCLCEENEDCTGDPCHETTLDLAIECDPCEYLDNCSPCKREMNASSIDPCECLEATADDCEVCFARDCVPDPCDLLENVDAIANGPDPDECRDCTETDTRDVCEPCKLVFGSAGDCDVGIQCNSYYVPCTVYDFGNGNSQRVVFGMPGVDAGGVVAWLAGVPVPGPVPGGLGVIALAGYYTVVGNMGTEVTATIEWLGNEFTVGSAMGSAYLGMLTYGYLTFNPAGASVHGELWHKTAGAQTTLPAGSGSWGGSRLWFATPGSHFEIDQAPGFPALPIVGAPVVVAADPVANAWHATVDLVGAGNVADGVVEWEANVHVPTSFIYNQWTLTADGMPMEATLHVAYEKLSTTEFVADVEFTGSEDVENGFTLYRGSTALVEIQNPPTEWHINIEHVAISSEMMQLGVEFVGQQAPLGANFYDTFNVHFDAGNYEVELNDLALQWTIEIEYARSGADLNSLSGLASTTGDMETSGEIVPFKLDAYAGAGAKSGGILIGEVLVTKGGASFVTVREIVEVAVDTTGNQIEASIGFGPGGYVEINLGKYDIGFDTMGLAQDITATIDLWGGLDINVEASAGVHVWVNKDGSTMVDLERLVSVEIKVTGSGGEITLGFDNGDATVSVGCLELTASNLVEVGFVWAIDGWHASAHVTEWMNPGGSIDVDCGDIWFELSDGGGGSDTYDLGWKSLSPPAGSLTGPGDCDDITVGGLFASLTAGLCRTG